MLPHLERNLVPACLALFAVLAAAPVFSDEKDLRETLERMEQLLQQQQAELEAQREELAEQRALIRQLQEGRQSSGSATPEASLADVEPLDETVPDQSGASSGQQQALAELSRREREGSEEQVDAETIRDDPANTTFDPNFPGAWHLPGTTAAMKISGYVNLALVNSFDPVLISDRFIVGSIPPEGESVPGARSGTDVTANQTRINYEVREETRYGMLRAFVEGDFEGNGDAFRLRHAFGQYRSVLAGKTSSTFMDIESQPEEVDFEGINGMILTRQAQLRFFPNFGKSLRFKAALEDPKTEVINGVGNRGMADLVLSVGRLPLGQLGDWNSRVGVILRDLEADLSEDDENEQNKSETTGWGITTSGRKSFAFWGEEDFVLWQLTYGKGVGRYINDLNTVGGGDAVFDPQGRLRALPVFAGYVSYGHGWPKDFWFLKAWPGILRSNLTLSWVAVDNFDFQDDRDYKRTLRASANLIYLPTRNLRLGMELLWGERKNKDNSSGTAAQFQVSARYNF